MAVGPKRGAALSPTRGRQNDVQRAGSHRGRSPARKGGDLHRCGRIRAARRDRRRRRELRRGRAVCPSGRAEGEQWRAVAQEGCGASGGVQVAGQRVCGSRRRRGGLLHGRRRGQCRWRGTWRVECVKQPKVTDPASLPATEKSRQQRAAGATVRGMTPHS